MRDFEHGTGSWHQFIKSVKISNIHGWDGQEMFFNFPVVAVVGENGIGKSTFLKAAVCAYENTAGQTFYPSKMFVSTRWDENALSNATIEYKVRIGNTSEKPLRWRKTNDWGFTPKKEKPKRPVFFLDISRTLPLDATAGYAKIAKTATTEAGSETVLTEDTIRELSYVLGHSYVGARFVGTDVNVERKIGLLTKDCGEISQFHQGAGEGSILDVFKLFQDIPNYSLLVIDEIENSLHPQAQRRLVQYLLKLAKAKKLQVILSTHSPFVLDELPPVARIMLMRLSGRKEIIYKFSTEFALSTIDDKTHPELFVSVEDEEAVALFWEIMKKADSRYSEICTKIAIRPVGSYTVVKKIDDLYRSGALPYKSLCIVDGDKRTECPHCLSLPGNIAPERQVFTDLKNLGWNKLDDRFGVGAGSLYKILDDACLLPDHHKWTEYVGDQIKRNKDYVWAIMIEEWCKQCLDESTATDFVSKVLDKLAT